MRRIKPPPAEGVCKKYMPKRIYIKKDEAIQLLSDGWEIFTQRNKVTGARGQLVYNSLTFVLAYPNKPDKNIHHSTIEALKKDKVIQSSAPYHLLTPLTVMVGDNQEYGLIQ